MYIMLNMTSINDWLYWILRIVTQFENLSHGFGFDIYRNTEIIDRYAYGVFCFNYYSYDGIAITIW